MMLLAALALAGVASWVPARWHSHDPQSLELLAGMPVNCLLLEHSEWDPNFIKTAHARHIALLGIVHAGAAPLNQVKDAPVLHLDGLVLEAATIEADLSRAARNTGLTVIELPARRGIRFDSRDPVLGTSQGLWPGVEVQHGGSSVTGPTSAPWIDTNAGFLRFVRGSTEAIIWMGVQPRPHTIYPVERYLEAVGDSALLGARWIVALDTNLEERLIARDADALRDWKKIGECLSFYENHPEWRGYRAYSRMAVVQDTNSGGLLSSSLLDMLSSQRTSIRVVPTRRLSQETLKGTRVLLDVDPDGLTPQQKEAVDAFAKAGGTVVNPPAKWRFPQTSDDQMILERRQADRLQSLWEVTYNATLRKNFGARTFNTTGILSSVLVAPDGKSAIVHLLNFMDFPGEAITIHVLGKWKRARLYQLGGPTLELPLFEVPEGSGAEIAHLTRIGTLRVDR